MLSGYDYAVIGAYFALLISIGLIFRKANRTTSDYFRSGGTVLWWMVGATAFMSQFSSWTFTGAASKAYDNGALVLVVYFASTVAFLLNWAVSAARLRRMRIITTLEGIRHRWGPGNEQFFSWLQVPLGILTAGIGLNGLAVILSAVFALPLEGTMMGAGLMVVVVATMGGSWAAIAGDFMQMLVLMAITAVAAFLALHHVGGMGAFVSKLPSHSLLWGQLMSPGLMWAWILAMIVKNTVIMNNMTDGYRYLCAKNDRHARWGALTAAILFIIGPVVWFIPPMVARVAFPDLRAVAALRPLGARIHEGAYLAMGLETMPAGMVGLLITALFATTISYMDTGLNKNAGIFIRSCYNQVIRPRASERELMVASKIATAGFGLLVILAALMFNRMANFSLFNLMQEFTALITLPIALPLCWGMFFRGTPPWSGWSTVLVCFTVSLVVDNLGLWRGAGAIRHLIAHLTPLAAANEPDVLFCVGVFANFTVGSLWFFATGWWNRRQPAAVHAEVDRFFLAMRTPVLSPSKASATGDAMQYRTIGSLAAIYGGFIALLALIPNPALGRACFVAVGFPIALVGGWLLRIRTSGPDGEPDSDSLLLFK